MLVPSRCNVINNTRYLDTAISILAPRKRKMDRTPASQTSFHPFSAKPSLIEAILHPTSYWMLTHLHLDCDSNTTGVPQCTLLSLHFQTKYNLLVSSHGILDEPITVNRKQRDTLRASQPLLYCSPQAHHPLQKTIQMFTCCSVSQAHVQHDLTLAVRLL